MSRTCKERTMRLSTLSSWWNERRDERALRRSLDSAHSDELLELIDEASSFGRRTPRAGPAPNPPRHPRPPRRADERDLLQVSHVHELQVDALRARLGELLQPGDDLVDRARDPVRAQIVEVPPDVGRPLGRLGLVLAARDRLRDPVDQLVRIAPDLTAGRPNPPELLPRLLQRRERDVELVGVDRGQSRRPLRALAADDDRRAR